MSGCDIAYVGISLSVSSLIAARGDILIRRTPRCPLSANNSRLLSMKKGRLHNTRLVPTVRKVI